MGSLMAGWQTNPLDEKEVLKRSTSSVTREEVERFWRVKKEIMERHIREAQGDANQPRSILVPAGPASESGGSPYGSFCGSPPITPTTPSGSHALESLGARSPGWWQKSYWAFLNEPPILEDRQNRYVAQYDLRAQSHATDLDAPTNSNVDMRHTRSLVLNTGGNGQRTWEISQTVSHSS